MTKTQANIIIILLLIAIGAPFLRMLKPVPKWEYKIEAPMDAMFDTLMNSEGRQGWDLVTARRATGALGASYECIFKRPK
jgi:hypothetical protein